MARTYRVRTYGCQMNEHDSERIAGLLEADGCAPPPTATTPTSWCSTPAASARTPTTSSTATSATSSRSRTANPGMQIVVAGCLAQKDRDLVRHGRRTSTSSSAPTTSHRAAELLARGPDRRPGHRDPRGRRRRRPRRVPLRAARRARAAATPPGSPSRSAATTRAPSASCRPCAAPRSAGPFDDIVAEVGRAGRRRRHRGHPARPERELLRPRPHARRRARPATPTSPRVRPLFADLLRRRRRRRRHPPGPLHQPAPQGPAPRDHRRHGRDARRCASTSTCRCSRAATGCWPPCTAATPPSATSSGWPRPAPPSPTWPSPPTSSSASPARPTTTSRTRSRSPPTAEYDTAYTFIFSPRPGTEAAELDRALRRRRRGRPSASSGSRVVVERSALPPSTRPASAASRRSLVEGPSRKDPARAHRPHPPEQARALRLAGAAARRAPTPPSRSPAPRRTTCAASCVERRCAAPRHRTRIPVAAG